MNSKYLKFIRVLSKFKKFLSRISHKTDKFRNFAIPNGGFNIADQN